MVYKILEVVDGLEVNYMHKNKIVDTDPKFEFAVENFRTIDGDIDYNKLEKSYLEEFKNLTVDVTYKGIEFRSLYDEMKMSKNWQETFLDNFFEEFCDPMENIDFDVAINSELCEQCNQFTWFKDRMSIMDYLSEKANSEAIIEDENIDLTEEELIEKYPVVLNKILDDFETIIRSLYKNYTFQYGGGLSLSFFASALDREFNFPVGEWIALEEAVMALK